MFKKLFGKRAKDRAKVRSKPLPIGGYAAGDKPLSEWRPPPPGPGAGMKPKPVSDPGR